MDYKSRIKNLIEWGREYQNTIFAVLILILMFFLGLGLGLLIRPNKPTPIIIDKNVKIGLPARAGLPAQSGLPSNSTGTNYVASINGSAYYPVNCKAAEKIKEENRVWFKTTQEAESQGYKPAQNCR